MKDFLPGDLASMVGTVREPMTVTVLRKLPHPFLSTLNAYKVLAMDGKTYSVSQSFLRPIA